ncbi:MAG: hypothetical protein WAL94_01770 [Bacteroidales bacterium]
MKKTILLFLAVMTCTLASLSQDTPGRFSAGGYATWLHNSVFEDPAEEWLNSSMLHNRLNFKAYPGTGITMALEIRNRFVLGDMVQLDPTYSTGLASDPGWVDMSWNILSEQSFVLNTFIDRAWIDYTSGKLRLTLGRQRINWSQALVWNPNDIFNTYSFFDFDYMERPGSDALRAVYSTGPSSAAEMVVKLDSSDRVTVAALYRFNVLNTDLQFFAGETNEELFTAGTGWSGAMGSYSIRGEATLFTPLGNSSVKETTFIATAGVDKTFTDKISALVQMMYSNNPFVLDNFTELYKGAITADQLALSEFSAIGQLTFTPVPLLNISLSAIWYPDLKGYFADATVDFSMAENVDFSLVMQHFDNVISGEVTKINMGFVRIKYSF